MGQYVLKQEQSNEQPEEVPDNEGENDSEDNDKEEEYDTEHTEAVNDMEVDKDEEYGSAQKIGNNISESSEVVWISTKKNVVR